MVAGSEENKMLTVETISTTELGDRSYIAHDGAIAIVIDPQRDIDRVESLLAQLELVCALVIETHIHNDYVTGGLVLAQRCGAIYAVAADAAVEFERHAVANGDELTAGSLSVVVVATPGHTEDHLSYVVSDADGTAVVFTGGSLLYGSVGRTDLVDPAKTDELTHAQYRSVHHLAEMLPDETSIYPTHGFGSFCSSGAASGAQASTIGVEKQQNDALASHDEDDFVERLIAGLTAYPSYYAHMAPLNRRGPALADLSPPEPVNPVVLARRIHAGEWVVDLRTQRAFAKEHLGGTISIALGDQFSTYLGWLMPWGSPLTLIGEDPSVVAAAQRQLVRIGIDRPDGAAVGSPRELAAGGVLRNYPAASFSELASAGEVGVLDVRRDDERAEGFVRGSLHIPIDELIGRMNELPKERLWVHCASGFRASIAASLLDRVGHDVVLVDDDFANAAPLGLLS
jgi:hydroxyacylglutathione hydrolase